MDAWQERVDFRVWMLGLPNRLTPCEIRRLTFVLWCIDQGVLVGDGPTYVFDRWGTPTPKGLRGM